MNTNFFDTITNIIKGEVNSALNLKLLSETSELKDKTSQELNERTKDNRDDIYLIEKSNNIFIK